MFYVAVWCHYCDNVIIYDIVFCVALSTRIALKTQADIGQGKTQTRRCSKRVVHAQKLAEQPEGEDDGRLPATYGANPLGH